MLLVLGTIWTGLFASANGDAPLSSLTAIAAAALLVALTAVAVRRFATPPGALRPALIRGAGAMSVRAATSRLRDPDAAGRPRPRAPSADPAV